MWSDLLAKLEDILDSEQLPTEYRTKWVIKLLLISKVPHDWSELHTIMS